jgi:cobalt-zinc-cadmium efflux system membrane fusion protein
LLADGTLALEITIFERGVPPEFRVYAYEEGKPLDPHAIDLTINLHRFGGRIDPFRFEPRDDYLAGDATVEEPHSFDVEVVAANAGGSHRWRYASHEGRTEISPAAIASSGIAMETVGPATIRRTVTAHGRIVLNEDHLAHYAPRYPGLVREARKRLGDPVARGDVLAVIESNESLQSYEIRSSIAGTVVAKDAAPGEFASESRVIYTVTDLSTVWADLYVSYDDFRLLRAGQIATVETREGKIRAEGALLHLSAVGTETTQKLLARVEVPNPGGEWRPGLFVTGKIAVGEENVPVAVKATALQKFRDWDVVFLNDGATFQAVPLELGRRDAEWVEVLSGLEPGQRYAAEGSFIVKADVGKSGATHDH